MERQSAAPNTGKTILVVDDDEAILKFVSGFLMQCGFRVLVANNGEDALKLSKEPGHEHDFHVGTVECNVCAQLDASDTRHLNVRQQKIDPAMPAQLRDVILNVLASPAAADIPDLDEHKERP